MRIQSFLLLAALTFSPAFGAQNSPPVPLREFRGAWVATVSNIDWPSTNRLSTAQQQAELIAILDRASALRLNAVIFQVRPACDALYASKLEPWSEYLTGEMGRPPAPFYDPLQFAVEEAHKRGLELHAWFNPYRARHRSAKSNPSANHISRTHPHLVKKYGEYLWLDPGEKEVQDHSLRVVLDVLERYDVDGIHFDDYFYPYKETQNGRELDFPDESSWQKYGRKAGLSRDDWRRENVNVFLKRTYQAIKARKPWVKFGISPFGIWRPGYPAQIKGYDAYDKLYADSRKWLNNGWLDYFAPQLYWAIDPPAQSYPALLDWWAAENKKHRHLWPGMSTANVNPRKWAPSEIVNQILLTRKEKGASGHIHWNMSALIRRPETGEALLKSVYPQPALVPESPWLRRERPAKPRIALGTSSGSTQTRLSWQKSGTTAISHWVFQTYNGSHWSTEVLPGTVSQKTLSSRPQRISVRAVDRYGNLSDPAVINQK